MTLTIDSFLEVVSRGLKDDSFAEDASVDKLRGYSNLTSAIRGIYGDSTQVNAEMECLAIMELEDHFNRSLSEEECIKFVSLPYQDAVTYLNNVTAA